MRSLLRSCYLNIVGSLSKTKPGIHIINSHYVTPLESDSKNDIDIFDDFLKYLSSKAKFINIDEATHRIVNNDISTNQTILTFTFDDGFEECYTIIAPLLEKYNCRGMFFINANYIESSVEYQKQFNKRIAIDTKKPMTWEQVRDLHNRGHFIGSHNLDHTNMAELDEHDLNFQIKENKKILEEKLNYKCDYFAWTYGQMQHFSESALEQTLNCHKYIFSGTNYKDYFSMDGKVINRRHLEPFWTKSQIKYFLSFKKSFRIL